MFRKNAGTGLELELFWSYKQILKNAKMRWEIIDNIFLFIPLGVILNKIYPHWVMVFLIVLFSVSIEATQYFTQTGLCELDDVISNGLGGAIGFGIARGVYNGLLGIQNRDSKEKVFFDRENTSKKIDSTVEFK